MYRLIAVNFLYNRIVRFINIIIFRWKHLQPLVLVITL